MSIGPQTGPHNLGKYELRELLGRGGSAEVWKAYDKQLERYVALKILHTDLQNDPNFIGRFQREARVIASLHHPNIVQIHDFQISRPPESSNSIAYMVMDYVEGQTLASYIRSTSRVGKFPSSDELLHLFASISNAVDYAHHKGMIHRDIKPANILLDSRHRSQNPMGEPILTDFGIVKLLGANMGITSGMWLGTPLYISPEQAQGHPGNERSDIYSLGVILYEICTGVPPFRGENIAAIMGQHINFMPTSPTLINPNILPPLAAVIMRCLAKRSEERFSSASALVAALAEALNRPIPVGLSQPTFPLEEMYGPTYFSSLQPDPSPGITPSSSPSPIMGSGQLLQSASASHPQQVALPGGKQDMRTTFINNTPGGSSFAHSVQTPQPPPGLEPSPLSPPLRSASRGRRRGMLIALIVLVILVLLGSGLGAFFWLTHNTPVAVTNQVVGHIFFVSSGQVSELSNQGINDEVQIDLQNIAAPAPGKSYYAWLLGDVSHALAPPILLGKLPVVNGTVQYHYPGDSHHTNLIAIASRFLLTEEDENITPSNPTPDQSSWRYSAALPQSVETMDMMHEGALQHIRHLLADAPELTGVGLTGGLDIWLFRNTEKVFEWAGSARDSWEAHDTYLIRNQTIRILDYLDGETYVQQDVPRGTPLLVNPRIGQVAMLEFDVQKQQPPSLLYLTGIHLNALAQAPGITKARRDLAAQIDQEINDVQNWLEQVRTYAKEIIATPMAQLLSPGSLSVLDSLETLARYAYIGQLDPNTNTVKGGVVQMHYNVQNLATLDITSYTSH